MKIPSIFKGDTFINKSGDVATVIYYMDGKNVHVVFSPDSNIHIFKAHNLRDGSFSNKYKPSVCGIGYVGIGKYSRKEHELADNAWRSMLKRCYSSQSLTRCPAYSDCIVCEEWHNFQVFAEWYVGQPNHAKGFDLDKDLLVRGNKVYSPINCCLLPRQINSFLQVKKVKEGSSQGITIRGDSYEVRIKLGGKTLWLGSFSTLEEAKSAYKYSKENYCKKLCRDWGRYLDEKTILALKRWEVDGEYL